MPPAWMLAISAWLVTGLGFLALLALGGALALWLLERIVKQMGLWKDVTVAVITVWERRRKERRT